MYRVQRWQLPQFGDTPMRCVRKKHLGSARHKFLVHGLSLLCFVSLLSFICCRYVVVLTFCLQHCPSNLASLVGSSSPTNCCMHLTSVFVFHCSVFCFCSACPLNCGFCATQSPTRCASCNAGYFLSNGLCVQCPYDHWSAYNATQCSSCPTGKSSHAGAPAVTSCFPCPANCQSCATTSQCISCMAGYAYSNGLCPPCPLNTWSPFDAFLCIPCPHATTAPVASPSLASCVG